MNAQVELAAKRYAKALWGAAGEKDAQATLESFEKFVEIYLSSDELQKLFSNPAFSPDQKQKVLIGLGEKAGFSKDLQNFLGMLLERNRIQIMGSILEAFRGRMMARDKVESVKIETALPMTDAQKSKIISTLESTYKTKFIATVDIVPELIAGIKLHFLGKTVDSTLTGALFQMRQHFLNSGLQMELGEG